MHDYIKQQVAEAYLADRITMAEKRRTTRLERPRRRHPRFALPGFVIGHPAPETQP
jgi:hypothetical protein